MSTSFTPVPKVGLLLSVFLIVIARPLSVFTALIPFRFNVREQMFISWAGLRGAAPIILAAIAVTSNVPHSQTLFNTVFFVAVLSVAAQGTTIDRAAKWLGVLDLNPTLSTTTLRFDLMASPNRQLAEFGVAPNSEAENKRIVDLRLPAGVLVLLVARDGEDVVRNGGTVLRRGDVIQLLADSAFLPHGNAIFTNG